MTPAPQAGVLLPCLQPPVTSPTCACNAQRDAPVVALLHLKGALVQAGVVFLTAQALHCHWVAFAPVKPVVPHRTPAVTELSACSAGYLQCSVDLSSIRERVRVSQCRSRARQAPAAAEPHLQPSVPWVGAVGQPHATDVAGRICTRRQAGIRQPGRHQAGTRQAGAMQSAEETMLRVSGKPCFQAAMR